MVFYVTEYTWSLLYKSRYRQLFDLSFHINVENRRSGFKKFDAQEHIHTLLDATFSKFLSTSFYSAMSVLRNLEAKMCNLFISILLPFIKIL